MPRGLPVCELRVAVAKDCSRTRCQYWDLLSGRAEAFKNPNEESSCKPLILNPWQLCFAPFENHQFIEGNLLAE
jgi:hypothetical protein